MHQLEALEQHAFSTLRFQQILQAEQTHRACALVTEVEQQLACWVSVVQLIETAQTNVLVRTLLPSVVGTTTCTLLLGVHPKGSECTCMHETRKINTGCLTDLQLLQRLVLYSLCLHFVFVQGKAWSLAAAQTTNKSETQKLRDAWVNQVTTLQQQLRSTQHRLADVIAGRDTDVDEMAARCTP